MSTSTVTNRYNILQSTSDAINTSTPNNKNRNKKLLQDHKTQQQHQAKTFARKLCNTSFIDTGYLINATTEEKQNIIALSKFYTLGQYDLSNTEITEIKVL